MLSSVERRCDWLARDYYISVANHRGLAGFNGREKLSCRPKLLFPSLGWFLLTDVVSLSPSLAQLTVVILIIIIVIIIVQSFSDTKLFLRIMLLERIPLLLTLACDVQRVVDHETWVMSLEQANHPDNALREPLWYPLYSAKRAYGEAVSSGTLSTLPRELMVRQLSLLLTLLCQVDSL